MKLLILSRATQGGYIESFDAHGMWKIFYLTLPQLGVQQHTLTYYQVLYRTSRCLNTFQSTNVSHFSLDITTISFETKYRRSKSRLSDGLAYSFSMSNLISRIVKALQHIFFQKQATRQED